MSRSFIFTILLLVFSLNLIAQNVKPRYAKFAPKTVLDQSNMECVYEYSITDPVLKEVRIYNNILQIGGKVSKYWDYNLYRIDSVISLMPDVNKITSKEALPIFNRYKYFKSRHELICKDKSSGIVSVEDKITMTKYSYSETLPVWEWILSDDTDTVCGYFCRKASTSFRGREWIAWYSEDIPEDNGPWKFSGLPGLILKIEDRDKEHVFEAKQIRRNIRKIEREDVTNIFKTNRLKFIKESDIYHGDPMKYMKSDNMMQSSLKNVKVESSPERKFYNQIERE